MSQVQVMRIELCQLCQLLELIDVEAAVLQIDEPLPAKTEAYD